MRSSVRLGGFYFEITKKTDKLMMRIKRAFEGKEIFPLIENFINQSFAILKDTDAPRLAKKCV